MVQCAVCVIDHVVEPHPLRLSSIYYRHTRLMLLSVLYVLQAAMLRIQPTPSQHVQSVVPSQKLSVRVIGSSLLLL